ncbi:hypothetical protein AYY19_08475 [Photobacterium aquimaris]|uniref:oligosaccharide repeat unit polymerase n=1 Tax=Photobacterium aquimaris TaxID=512643 RepID=UPI0007EF8394|nr:oligosaccharide repeat unit polymerase [Photobacterium aquimaris]OBU11938.1 hypothetical protein AYY19_08475 [Photobacterium aquimaris]PSW01972.1 hypothetical protein CTM91_06770 [Photobacterium aquimaris]
MTNKLLLYTSLIYILVVMTIGEYYFPVVQLNVQVIISLIFLLSLVLTILSSRKLPYINVNILIYSIYWVAILILTFSALLYSSLNFIKYILYVLPIIFIPAYFYKNEIFLRKCLFIIKFAVVLNLLIVLLSFIQMVFHFDVYTKIRLLLSYFSNHESDFLINPSLRSQGIFYNSSSLAILGIFSITFMVIFRCMSLWLFIASVLLVVFSGSRVPLFCVVIFISLYKGLNFKKIILVMLFLLLAFVFIDYNYLVDFFSRISRVYDDGLFNDYSLMYRINILWPNAISMTSDYYYGTLKNPVEIVGVIDSGYITTYIQGRWFLVFSLLLSFSILLAVSFYDFLKNKNLFFILIPLYLVIGMLISNPIMNSLVVMSSYFYLFSRLNN